MVKVGDIYRNLHGAEPNGGGRKGIFIAPPPLVHSGQTGALRMPSGDGLH